MAPERDGQGTGTYRPDIDGLRAVAVVAVVLYHAGLPWLPGGFAGVDVFFVISGYLITGILCRDIAAGRFSLLTFYERRARRILPALFAMLALSSVGAWALMLPPDFLRYGESLLAVLVFAANHFFAATLGDYFAPEAEFQPLLHMWSLAVEEQFYLLFPLLLIPLIRARRRRAIGTLALLSGASLLLAQARLGTDPVAAFYHAAPRAWELAAGALLALAGPPRLARGLREAAAVLGLGLILWALLALDRATPFPGLAALPPVLGAMLLIAAGPATLANRLLGTRGFVFVGLISYSLYLMHWPVMALLRIHIGTVHLSPRNAGLAIAVSLLAAVLSWALVERPFRDRARIGRGAVFGLSGAAAVLTAGFALAVIRGQGLPQRFPPGVMLIAAGAEDRNPRRAECFDRWPEAGLCRIGAGGPPEFLLWGDSHADALMPGLDLVARQAGRSGLVLVHGGCPPLLGVHDPAQAWGQRCLAFYDRLIGELETRPGIAQVILAARWGVAFGLPRPEGGAGLSLRDLERPDVAEPAPEVFERGLRRSLAALRAQGREVVLLAPLPEIGWHVPQQLLRQARLGRALPPRPTLTTLAARNAGVEALFHRLAGDYGARLVTLADRLCTPDCAVIRDGHPLYVDDDHLSAFAARALAPALAARLWGVVPPPATGEMR